MVVKNSWDSPTSMAQQPEAGPSWALSEERWRGRKSEPPVVSSGNLTPFGKGERAIEFEDLAAAKMTFLVKMVVDRSMDQNEFL